MTLQHAVDALSSAAGSHDSDMRTLQSRLSPETVYAMIAMHVNAMLAWCQWDVSMVSMGCQHDGKVTYK